ncbi:MAG: DUF1553 domain-containing protein [Bryobacteraceae bacterium]
MMGIRIAPAVGIVLSLALPFGASLFAQAPPPDEKTAGISDCTFSSDPDHFLQVERRARRAIHERAGKLNAALGPAAAVQAESLPIRNFIDQEILSRLASKNIPVARLTTDEEFVRRIYLDLTGRIPSSAQIREFLADPNRDALIDKLLYSAESTDRWTMWMGDWLQNTSTLTAVGFQRQVNGRNAFHNYIRDAVFSQKSLRDVAWEMLTGIGNNYDAGPANFPMAASTTGGPAEDNYDMLLAKSASTFLGLGYYDCGLCHNGRGHLDQLSLWGASVTRTESQKMAAFFSRVRFEAIREPAPPPGQPASFYTNSYKVNELASGAYNLNSTFGNRPNRVPIGAVRTLTPEYRLGGVPKDENWRNAFAGFLVDDPMFARNLANRLWKTMFNLGLVDPVDTLDPARLDPDSPPSAPWTFQATHPQLLEKLARYLRENNYGLRELVKVLVQSTSYQLSSRYDAEWSPEYVPLFARHYPRRLEGEEIHDALTKATEVPASYPIQGWAEPAAWAMMTPEPLEPRGNQGNGNTFMNYFFRGNRDNVLRVQSGSIQQQLALMNDQFVVNRLRVTASPKLRSVAALANNGDVLDELYLTFLSRLPAPLERTRGLAFLAKNNTNALRNNAVEDLAWALVNKIEFLFSY